ncbi:MAG: hypothetical protein KC493_08555, partial [Bacteriovoracaceae bacterium]|nr:hypothetical protein [Bacteriovoracaceae bacterium]
QSCKAIDLPIDRETQPLKGVYSAKIVDGQKGVSGGRVRKITNNTAYVNSHKVLKELRNDESYPSGPQCRDATKTPPVFGYGSRKIPSRNTGMVKIFSKGSGVARTSKAAAGIDCSSFISNALGAQGLKVSKTSGPFTSHTTRSFHAQANKSNSCLKHAKVTPDDAIRPGDMINVSSSHIVMVDSVGDDPLGIKKYSATGNCNGINPREFDFTYVHSGAIRNSYGPSRVKANVHSGGTMWNNLRVLAVKLCQKKVAQDNAIRDSRMVGMSTRFSLIRHQSNDPQCISDKRIKIEGEDCINKCENVNKDIQSDT